jgi:hypothetical protein
VLLLVTAGVRSRSVSLTAEQQEEYILVLVLETESDRHSARASRIRPEPWRVETAIED